MGLLSFGRLRLLSELSTVTFQPLDLPPSQSHGAFFNA
jgi:hypothetical protein